MPDLIQKDLKDRLLKTIEAKAGGAMDLAKALYDHPETGCKEVFAHDLLTDWLEKEGFRVRRQLVMPTAFSAACGPENGKPVIGIPAEYDALPGIGHGCGHNLFGAISILAAASLKDLAEELGIQVLLLGTPAEENFGGKVQLAEAGVFDGLDAALMLHPGTVDSLGGASLALYPVKFEFHGKPAHGCHPAQGASALDAAVLSYMSINMQRQFMGPGTYIHGIIKDGGEAANVIPGYASLEYYFRAPSIAQAKEMAKQAGDRAQASADATGCKMEASVYECPYGETLLNDGLADLMEEVFEDLGRTQVKALDRTPSGSSDVGALSFVCPTIQGEIKIAEPDQAKAHSMELAKATISETGYQALKDGAGVLAEMALALALDPDRLQAIQEEWAEKKKANI